MGTYQGTFYFSGHQKSECPLVCPISKAFDEVPAFQGNYVKGQRERVLTDIFDRVKEKVSSGICNGSLRYTIASKDIGKTSLWGSGLLGYELATPHRVDAKHEITVAWRQTGLFNETAINYQVASTYEWHDEIDWNDVYEARANARLSEGLIQDPLFDKALDMEYWITIEYLKAWQGAAQFSE